MINNPYLFGAMVGILAVSPLLLAMWCFRWQYRRRVNRITRPQTAPPKPMGLVPTGEILISSKHLPKHMGRTITIPSSLTSTGRKPAQSSESLRNSEDSGYPGLTPPFSWPEASTDTYSNSISDSSPSDNSSSFDFGGGDFSGSGAGDDY